MGQFGGFIDRETSGKLRVATDATARIASPRAAGRDTDARARRRDWRCIERREMSRGDSSARSDGGASGRCARTSVGWMRRRAREGRVGSPVAEVEGAREDGSASGFWGTSEFRGIDVAREG